MAIVGATIRFFHTNINKKEGDDWSAFLKIVKEVDLPIKPLDNLKDNDINLATTD